ncbi:MAG: hypothetical protein PHX80_04120 [Candidatus Nanoarchaeia archaeon]|nr:hypothetical protein [Candidatus Nanoarchaeia archaeon]
MSWGERSCNKYPEATCGYKREFSTCNVDCPGYEWDKTHIPEWESLFDFVKKHIKENRK